MTADRQKSWLIELTKRIELKAGIVSLQILFFSGLVNKLLARNVLYVFHGATAWEDHLI